MLANNWKPKLKANSEAAKNMPTDALPAQQLSPSRTRATRLYLPFEFGLTLDQSGSMDDVQHQVINGFNLLVDQQRTLAAGPLATSLVTFASEANLLYDQVPIEEMPRLTEASYQPDGATALLDGIGSICETIGTRFDAAEHPPRVLIAIITDGEENSSKMYSLEDIAAEITFRRAENNWEFIYLAAGDCAVRYGLRLGIPKSNIIDFLTSDIGPLLLKLSQALAQLRLGDKDYLLQLTNE
jgi:hypothetical protein